MDEATLSGPRPPATNPRGYPNDNERNLRRLYRPRNDRHSIHGLRPRGNGSSRTPTRSTNRSIPEPGWVEHDPLEIWENTQSVIEPGARGRGHRGRPTRRARRHQPARDDAVLGRGNRQTGPQRHRLAGPPDDRPHRTVGSGRQSGRRSREDGTPTGRVLLGDEGRMAARQRRTHQDPARSPGGLARPRRNRRNPLRNDRLVADLQPDGRTHHGRDERLADDAVRHPRDGLGRRTPARSSTFRARCCPRSDRRATTTRTVRPTPRGSSGAEIPVAGALGDQQAALFGQTCFDAGRRQEHLRDGQLLPAEHGQRGRRERTRPAHDGRIPALGRTRPVRARRVHLRHRRGHRMARGHGPHRRRRRRPRTSPEASIPRTASTWFPPSLASVRPTGTSALAVPSSG